MEMNLPVIKLETRNLTKKFSATEGVAAVSYTHLRCKSVYTMMQVCRELDMTYQTLKFYCNEGLVPNVKRDHSNRRVCDEKDVKGIKDLTCLKKRGMSIQEMKKYLELCLQGEATIVSRKKMLARKQEELRASICLLYTSRCV